MGNVPSKSEDLVYADNSESPTSKIFVVDCGKKKLDYQRKKLKGFLLNVDDYDDSCLGNIAELRRELQQAMKNIILSAEQQSEIMINLKYRFENRKLRSVQEVLWEDLQKKLEENPEKLWCLNEMDKTGGEPNLIKYNQETDEYVFYDTSPETPSGRVNCVYNSQGEENLSKDFANEMYSGNAISMAALMGVNILTEIEYRELQLYGEFDTTTWSWIRVTDHQRSNSGETFFAELDAEGFVCVRKAEPHYFSFFWGFRASLRV